VFCRGKKSVYIQKFYTGKEANFKNIRAEGLAGKLCVKNLGLNVFKNRHMTFY